MSRFEDLKEKLKSIAQQLGEKIQETEGYNQLQDRYQSLNANSQRLVWIIGSFLILALVLFYPLGQISNSQSLITSFEEKRTLIHDLFKTYRESSGNSGVPVPPQFESLKASVETIINGANLIPEQRVGTIQSVVEGRLIPQSLVSHVLDVKLAKLNLKQIVDIGTALSGISESVKMKDLVISAHAADTRYFDVSYKLYSLNVPEVIPEPPQEIEIKPKKGNTSGKGNPGKSKDDDQ